MPEFYALVDATPGQEKQVGDSLRSIRGLKGVAACKAGNMDFLVKFEAAAFGHVDDFLQTYLRRLPGVKGVEVIVDFDDHPSIVREARDKLG